MKRLIWILVSFVCFGMGIFILVSYVHAQKTQTAHMTAAIVRVDSEVETDSDGYDTRMYYPVVEYTVNGQSYEKRLPDSGTSNSTTYKEGQTVEIQYNPDKPEELSKQGSKGGLIGGIFFIAFGFISVAGVLIGKMN